MNLLSQSEVLAATTLIYLIGKRISEKELRVGDRILSSFPDFVKIDELFFDFSDEEEIEDDTVQACYFRRYI